MFEHRKQPLISSATFYWRVFKHILVAMLIISISLLIGVAGYHFIAQLSWIDSIHNASMILSGMGLVDPIHSEAGKIFSSIYALFSGVIFITNFGIILAPAAHRLYHRLHIDTP
jgi:hypothetical protein